MTILFQPAPEGTTHFLRFASGYVIWCKVEQGENKQLILKEWDSANEYWVTGIRPVEHYQTAGLMSIDDFPGEAASPTPDNAPAGATHYYSHGGEVSWYRETEKGLFVWRDGSWYASTYKTALDLAKVCPLGAVSAIEEEKHPDMAEDDLALTWLARNVPLEQVRGWVQKAMEGFNIIPSGMPSAILGQPMWFSAREVLGRRAELQSKPSWSDAPEWAEWLAQDGDGGWWFYRCVPKTALLVWRGTDRHYANDGEVLGDWRDTLERRPEAMTTTVSQEDLDQLTDASMEAIATAEPAQATFSEVMDWFERGELPPVGVECEVFGKGASPEKCKIIAYHKDQVAVQWESFGGGILDVLYLRGDYWKFRPIRTERDKAIEAMRALCPYPGSWETTYKLFAEALYDAGYRAGGAA